MVSATDQLLQTADSHDGAHYHIFDTCRGPPTAWPRFLSSDPISDPISKAISKAISIHRRLCREGHWGGRVTSLYHANHWRFYNLHV